jgi:hypothetical protein
VASAAPGSAWTGGAADAYGAANVEHRHVLYRLAGLDRQLGAAVDSAADVVTVGRTDLDAVKQWVTDAAASVPPGAASQQMLLSIAQTGMGRLIEIIAQANGDLSSIGDRIRTLGEKYGALGPDEKGLGEAGGLGTDDEDETQPLDEEKRKEERRRDLGEILREYQVSADPDGTVTVDLPGMDPFRHAYANALLTERFGQEWTAAYTKAHEQLPGNASVVEAMDLYNNEVGRGIAAANPDASPEELADAVQQSIENGEMVVVRTDGQGLEWTDRIPTEQTGSGGDSPPIEGTDPEGAPPPLPDYDVGEPG